MEAGGRDTRAALCRLNRWLIAAERPVRLKSDTAHACDSATSVPEKAMPPRDISARRTKQVSRLKIPQPIFNLTSNGLLKYQSIYFNLSLALCQQLPWNETGKEARRRSRLHLSIGFIFQLGHGIVTDFHSVTCVLCV